MNASTPQDNGIAPSLPRGTFGPRDRRRNGSRPDQTEPERGEVRDRTFALDPFEEERRARAGARRRYITY